MDFFHNLDKKEKAARKPRKPRLSGKKNEDNFIKTINKYIYNNSTLQGTTPINKPITLVFTENKKLVFQMKDVYQVNNVARKDPFSGKKADAVLKIRNSNDIPISIKQDDARAWESSDSYWGEEASKFLAYVVTTGKTELIEGTNNNWSIKPKLAIKATNEEALKVCFGTDILNGGAILKRTFIDEDFSWEEIEQTLTINSSFVWRSLQDIPDKYFPYFEIFNSKDRNVKSLKLKGLRTQALPEYKLTKTGYLKFNNDVRRYWTTPIDIENKIPIYVFDKHWETSESLNTDNRSDVFYGPLKENPEDPKNPNTVIYKGKDYKVNNYSMNSGVFRLPCIFV